MPTRFTRFMFCLLIALTTTLYADVPIARMTVSATFVEWQALGPNDGVSLTVMGPDGFTYTQYFTPGKPATFRLQDIQGIDISGNYTWELRANPRVPADVRNALIQARAQNDDKQIEQIRRAANLTGVLVQSGAISIVNDAFVSNTLDEVPGHPSSILRKATTAASSASALPPVRTLDQVIPDDAIVQGSLCVGLGCVDNEAFGSDTVRLKQADTRLKFDDTSTTPGFPTHDWQLTANDSFSGGANKFSIEDVSAATVPVTITGAAPTNSVFVADTGKVGFRTATPGLDLHMKTGDTPAIRFEQTGDRGFTPQTWDIGANEANFFVRDLTGGSRLPFRIRPGAPTSSIDISANGNVGIGTFNPTSKLHVFSAVNTDSYATFGFDSVTGPALNVGYGGLSLGRGAAFLNVRPDSGAVAPNPSIRLMTANKTALLIDNEQYIGIGGVTDPTAPIEHISGAKLTAAGQWQSVSSRAAKTDIHDISRSEAAQALRQLEPVHFYYKKALNDPQVGFIAEDVPEIVATPDRKTLNPIEIVAVLTKVVQDQQKTIDDLTKRLEALEKK